MIPALWIVLAIVAVQRIGELVYASRNAKNLLANGGVEIAPQQHGYFVTLHAAWILCLLVFVPAWTTPSWPLLAFFFALQAARVWIIATLGRYWTTRIVTMPNAPLVREGPYRWVRHPNYVVVTLEIALLPLAFHQAAIAVIFSALNAVLIVWRVREEDRALEARRSRTG